MNDNIFPLRVRFSPILFILALVTAVINLAAYTYTQTPMQLGLGALFTVLGILFMGASALVVTTTEVQLKNALRMTVKSHPIDSLADLEIRGSKLFLVRGGQKRKLISLNYFVANGRDAKLLRHAIEAVKDR